MAKPSRRERDRRAAEAAGSDDRTSRSPSGSQRAGRRDRRPTYQRRGFLDRFGGLILLAFAGAGVLAVAFLFFQSSTQRAYACDTLLTPGPSDPIPTATPGPTTSPTPDPAASPTASPSPEPTLAPGESPTPTPTPEPAPTARLGFVVSDLGRDHITDTSRQVRYAYCPPGSGAHWNVSGEAPLRRAFYGPSERVVPEQWIHDLEHGFALLLYSCGAKGDSCPSTDEMASLEAIFSGAPTTAGAVACGLPNKLIAARFDDMSSRFAAVAWDRALLLDELDRASLLTFAEQWIDGPAAPERGACDR